MVKKCINLYFENQTILQDFEREFMLRTGKALNDTVLINALINCIELSNEDYKNLLINYLIGFLDK